MQIGIRKSTIGFCTFLDDSLIFEKFVKQGTMSKSLAKIIILYLIILDQESSLTATLTQTF